MPNIMFYGFDSDTIYVALLRSKMNMVIETMRELGLGQEAVVTTVNSECFACDGEQTPSPYIRICGTSPTEINAIVEALRAKKLGIDCETILLTDFIPGDQMGSDEPDDDDFTDDEPT